MNNSLSWSELEPTLDPRTLSRLILEENLPLDKAVVYFNKIYASLHVRPEISNYERNATAIYCLLFLTSYYNEDNRPLPTDGELYNPDHYFKNFYLDSWVSTHLWAELADRRNNPRELEVLFGQLPQSITRKTVFDFPSNPIPLRPLLELARIRKELPETNIELLLPFVGLGESFSEEVKTEMGKINANLF